MFCRIRKSRNFKYRNSQIRCCNIGRKIREIGSRSKKTPVPVKSQVPQMNIPGAVTGPAEDAHADRADDAYAAERCGAETAETKE